MDGSRLGSASPSGTLEGRHDRWCRGGETGSAGEIRLWALYGKGVDTETPKVGARSLSFCGILLFFVNFPWVSWRLSHPAGPILGSACLWLFFCSAGTSLYMPSLSTMFLFFLMVGPAGNRRFVGSGRPRGPRNGFKKFLLEHHCGKGADTETP